jgi:hypothetical protein
MPVGVRAAVEHSLGVDMRDVRIHTGGAAERAAETLSARAFAYGPNIVLGAGERADDLSVIAHESAHIVQQRGAPVVQRLGAGQSDLLEHEAHAAAQAAVRGEQYTVQGRANGERVQRLGIGDALDYVADKANKIPGFRMLTIILGVNPVNMSKVDRSPANILRALIEVMPGGTLISDALQNHGIFDKVGVWVEQQITILGIVGSSIKQALTTFIDSLKLGDLLDLGGVWERAKRIFTDPIDRIVTFAKGLVNGIITFIKDAILMPLAMLAEGTRGWDLLIAVLGKNPITGEAVPRNAETLVGGFMKLIGQEEVWENVKKANAIGRVWAWFQGAIGTLMAFVQQIPTLAVNTFKSLELVDIVVLPRAFAKVATVFGDFVGSFIKWAGDAVWNLLEIIVEVLAPSAIPYLKKAAAAFRIILKDPIGFVGNLVRAGKLGFEMFAKNVPDHLKTALIKWITGPLGAAGVYIPKSFSLIEIVKLVLSVLGLTWQNIRTKLLTIIPEPVLVGLEKTASILVTLVKDGPAAAWEQIKAELSELKDQLIAQITQMVTTEVVKAAVVKLVSMLNPAGAVVQAIIAIYNTVTFFIQKINQIGAVVASFIDSISAIASGQVDNAAKKVEQTMANTLTIIIAFLAKFAGLGNIPEKVVGVIKKIRQPIDKGLDKIVAWLGKMLENAKNALMGKKDDKRTEEQKKADLDKGMAEGESLLTVPEPDLAHIESRLPTIKSKFKLSVLELRVDSSTGDDETVHIHGEVNPTGDKPKHRVKKGGPDAIISLADLDFNRPGFRVSTKKQLRTLHILRGGSARIMSAQGQFKGKKYHRRHVVSWGDLKRHFQEIFANKTVKAAATILSREGVTVELQRPAVVKAIKAKARDAFNDEQNLWIGLGAENSALQDVLDDASPEFLDAKGRIAQDKVDKKVAEFIAAHAIGGQSFKVTTKVGVIDWEVMYV